MGAAHGAYRTVGAIYRQGDVAAAGDSLAMNFLLDRSAENWRSELRRLRGIVGECDTGAPITATGALSGTFSWRGEHRRLEGTSFWLRPTRRPSSRFVSPSRRREPAAASPPDGAGRPKFRAGSHRR
ncbi:MAG TPA: hypothetical protein VGO11_05005 [Chthoniobacteraceae bacterium]|jgi:hypothetical protein|nr:hypothetical protein [Chthoniobacteraceae bacterium]